MGIEMTTSPDELDNYMQEQINRQINAVITAFGDVGAKCQSEAITGGTYKDRTGNLRNSVWYVVLHDGVIVASGGVAPGEGGETAKTEMDRIQANYSTGIVLIVVAGMSYAAAVEARNFNVLTSAELLCEQLVPQLMEQMGFKTE